MLYASDRSFPPPSDVPAQTTRRSAPQTYLTHAARSKDFHGFVNPPIYRGSTVLFETMDDAGGAGLAAPQVHVPLRLFVFRVPAGRNSGDALDLPMANSAVINPEIEAVDEEMRHGWEGCLSLPGLRGLVPRRWRIRYRGVDSAGAPVGGAVSGFHAQVVQHEVDHLDGILYPMRISDFRFFGFTEELGRYATAGRQP